jgi:hypothetical protein
MCVIYIYICVCVFRCFRKRVELHSVQELTHPFELAPGSLWQATAKKGNVAGVKNSLISLIVIYYNIL